MPCMVGAVITRRVSANSIPFWCSNVPKAYVTGRAPQLFDGQRLVVNF